MLPYTFQLFIVRTGHKTGSGKLNVRPGVVKETHTWFSSISLFSCHVTEEVSEEAMSSRCCSYKMVEPLLASVSEWLHGVETLLTTWICKISEKTRDHYFVKSVRFTGYLLLQHNLAWTDTPPFHPLSTSLSHPFRTHTDTLYREHLCKVDKQCSPSSVILYSLSCIEEANLHQRLVL